MTANETSIAKLTAVAKAYLVENNISAPFQVSREFVLDLVCKIAKSKELDGIFEDHFPELDGEYLESARGIEEYYVDLVDVKEYSREGSTTLAPAETPHRAPVYSWDSGRRSSKITIWDNELEKGVRSLDELASVIARVMKRLYDSHEVWREKAKIELLGKAAERVYEASDPSYADDDYATWAAAKTALVAATNGGLDLAFTIDGGTTLYRVVNPVVAGDTITDEATALSSGKIVIMRQITELADVKDTATGEAFVKSIKAFVRKSKFAAEGQSINGSAIGGTPEGDLYLYLDADLISLLEVDVEAGAVHEGKVALPATIRELPAPLYVASGATKVLGMIVDTRGIKMHPTHRNVREQDNAEGEFRNYYLHCNYTLVISPNVRIHLWLEKGE